MAKNNLGEYALYVLYENIVFKKDENGNDTTEVDSIFYTIEDPDGNIVGEHYTSLEEAQDAFIALMNQKFPIKHKPIKFTK